MLKALGHGPWDELVVSPRPQTRNKMALKNVKNFLGGLCIIAYFFCSICQECLFPLVFLIRVVDDENNRPLSGVQLQLTAYDERMLLPGYPKIVGVSNSQGMISGRLATSFLSYCPSYHLLPSNAYSQRIPDSGWVRPQGGRSVLGFIWLTRLLRRPQVVTLSKEWSSHGT